MSLISINSDCLDIFFNSPYENSGKIMLQYEMPTRSPDSEPFSTSYESCSSTLPPTEAFVITVPSAGCSPPLLTELPKNVCPTNCVVCGGDLASGYHYDVPSCNGCKTFFRRTLISQTRHRCKKDGNCFAVLPKLKRCSCRACRFQQCVEVGMNPLASNLPEESRSNQLVAEVLGKRKVSREQESSSVETKLVPSRLLSVECLMEKLISSLEYFELKTDKFRKCRYNPNPFELPNLEDLLQQSCSLDIADRVGPMHDWPRPHCVPQLPERSWDPSSRKHWFSFDLLTTIEYAKTFPFLHKLSQADQIVLMQAVALMCLKLTHSFFSYSMKSDQIIHPDGTPIPSPPPPPRI